MMPLNTLIQPYVCPLKLALDMDSYMCIWIHHCNKFHSSMPDLCTHRHSYIYIYIHNHIHTILCSIMYILWTLCMCVNFEKAYPWKLYCTSQHFMNKESLTLKHKFIFVDNFSGKSPLLTILVCSCWLRSMCQGLLLRSRHMSSNVWSSTIRFSPWPLDPSFQPFRWVTVSEAW